jgi:hypothetical protein
MKRPVSVVLVAGVVAVLGGCSEKSKPTSPPEPQPGVLTVRLTTPSSDDGALLLRLAGVGPIGEISLPSGSAYVVHARGQGSTVHVAVFGQIGAGDLVQFSVPDVTKASGYSATLLEVADRANALRASTQGYTLSLVP